jgi:diguanylate cyclase (GGDEF)-like protein/PAS domain S-box-containing protein
MKKIKDSFIAYLLRLKTWKLITFGVLSAVIFSEIIVSMIDILWDGKLNLELLFAGFVTPLIDAFFILLFFTAIISKLRVNLILVQHKENELWQANAFSKAVFDSMKDAVSVIDVKNFKILQCNEVFLKDFDLKSEDVIGKTCHEVTHRKSVPCVAPGDPCPIRRTLETGKHAAADHVHYAKDGKKKYLRITTSPVKDKEGNVFQIVHVASDITETKHMLHKLEKLALMDKLTATFNRMKFDTIIQKEMERAARYIKPLSLIMFDIDHFKKINDKYGHLAGDDILKSIANIAKKHIRKADYLFRWGGEEFMILAPETGSIQAASSAERIRISLEQYTFREAGKATASFGIAQFTNGDKIDDLVKKVDSALYKAKSSGRNRIEITLP